MATVAAVLVLSYLVLATAAPASTNVSKESFRFAFSGRRHFQQQLDLSASAAVSGSFDQRVDHLNPQDTRLFSQRYFENLQYFKSFKGPIILNLCGEGEAKPSCNGDLADYLAKEFGAAIVTLEHRYYGSSYPLPVDTVEDFKYLTTDQALNDIASFREYYQKTINQRHQTTGSNPWLVIGTSYAGALSAWFRLKFPHLVQGSIAGSAPVNIIEDFEAMDAMVSASSCRTIFQQIMSTIEERLETEATRVKLNFGVSTDMDNTDFLRYLAAGTTIPVTIDGGLGFEYYCGVLMNESKNTDLEELYADYMFDLKDAVPSWEIYDRHYMKNANDRSWYFQECTEMGFFHVAAKTNNVRSSRLNKQYYRDWCEAVFGVLPRVNETNSKYGGADIEGTRIIFTNGSIDFWRLASKLKSSLSEPAIMMTCDGCKHGMGFLEYDCDMLGSNTEAQTHNTNLCKAELKRFRGRILKLTRSWLYA